MGNLVCEEQHKTRIAHATGQLHAVPSGRHPILASPFLSKHEHAYMLTYTPRHPVGNP